MKRTRRSIQLILLVLAVASPPLVAADGPVANSLEAYRVLLNPDGSETFERTEEIAPGDRIEYRLIYENVSDGPVSRLVVTIPVPAQTEYLAGTADADVRHRLLVSIDGAAAFASEPVTRTGPDGRALVVPPEEYTHIRWESARPLGASETQIYRYRVEVEK